MDEMKNPNRHARQNRSDTPRKTHIIKLRVTAEEMKTVRKNSIELTREDLKTASESRTMDLSKTPATEPSKQASVTRH